MNRPSAAEMFAARDAGRRAQVGAVNPFTGRGHLAVAWRHGYRANLAARMREVNTRRGK